MKFTLFIPIKNEVEGLKAIMPRIRKEWVDEILIVDAHSTDGSREYLIENGYTFVDQKSKGVRGAFWEAFEIAQGDVIIPFSPDNNSVPEDIPLLIEKINEGYDMVIASRYHAGMKSADDDFMSRLANLCLTKLINLLYSATYTDALTMFKAFKKKHLYELGIDKRKHEFSEILLVCRAARRKLKITQIPSYEPARIGPPGSRAHPGRLGKYKSGLLILKMILRDSVFFPAKAPTTLPTSQEQVVSVSGK
jgi:glycosyltransferase involved in cell wall biosynthesis